MLREIAPEVNLILPEHKHVTNVKQKKVIEKFEEITSSRMRDFVNMLSHTLSLHKFESQSELVELLKFLFITLTNDIKSAILGEV